MLLVTAITCRAEVVPNSAFESGDLQPSGWTLASGDGDWATVDGDRALVSRGTDGQTSIWRSERVGCGPGAL